MKEEPTKLSGYLERILFTLNDERRQPVTWEITSLNKLRWTDWMERIFFFAWQEDKYNFFSFFVFVFCLLLLLLFFLLSVQRLLSMTRKGRLSCWTWSIGNNFLGKNTDGFGMSIFLWALDILLVIAFTLKSAINFYECFLLFHVLLITPFIMGEILQCTHVWNQFFFLLQDCLS